MSMETEIKVAKLEDRVAFLEDMVKGLTVQQGEYAVVKNGQRWWGVAAPTGEQIGKANMTEAEAAAEVERLNRVG